MTSSIDDTTRAAPTTLTSGGDYETKDPNTVEIIRCYQRLSMKSGAQVITETVLCNDIKDRVGWHGIREEKMKNNYPFVFFKLENRSRYVHDSRGWPELVRGRAGAAEKSRGLP